MIERSVTLSGHELKAALEFLNPDGDKDPEQRDGELVIAWLEGDSLPLDEDATHGEGHEVRMEPGYYACYADYQEEGWISMTHNAAVQPQIRAQREFVGWNCLLDAMRLLETRRPDKHISASSRNGQQDGGNTDRK
jgi:hypothetical protein